MRRTPTPSRGRSGSTRCRAREPEAPLAGTVDADLCIIGGGFTGLWAALHAKADDPGRDVVLLEGQTVGFGGSGRNGGFVAHSLTHGLVNGLARFADEMDVLERLGRDNLAGLVADLERHGIDCDLEQTGSLTPILAPYQDEWLEEDRRLHERFGHEVEVFPDARVHAGGGGLADLPRRAVGARRGRRARPGQAHRRAAPRGLGRRRPGARAVARDRDRRGAGQRRRPDRRGRGARQARGPRHGRVPAAVRTIGLFIVPVYDYVLVTEPLSAAQRESIGWRRRQGLSDGGNQFHYYRLTRDDRILWGGYDAVYRFRGPVRDDLDDHGPTFARLSQNFFTTFPQLAGLRFTHRWGGAIDTCSRFSVFFGTAHGGRLAYAVGYTGLGVGATRFGARVALDLVDGRDTEATRTRYVRRKPVPFPPEPIRTAVIQLTRNRLAAADRRDGRRGLWLGTLDRLGLGFDS